MGSSGICYLVGAGPGDLDLITVRGLKCLQRAEVVYYDHLVSKALLDEAPPAAERHYVGKRSGCHSVPQDQICERLCADVTAGRTVVRLKGGDPFVFGRGGEEALALAEAGLAFEVVPGVTAGVGASAYAGIPVTHRHVSRAVTFVTGHEAIGEDAHPTDWESLARFPHTLCIYMGVKNLSAISEALIRGGRPASEPAAIIEWGTTARQRCVAGTLGDLAERAEAEQVRPPAMVVVGEVVSLRESLQWFEARTAPALRIVPAEPAGPDAVRPRAARVPRGAGSEAVLRSSCGG